MELKVSRNDFLKKLSGIKSIIGKKGVTGDRNILSHFLIEANKKEVTIKATDLETSVKVPISCEVIEPGSICVPGEKLSEIVRELSEDITMKLNEMSLSINSGNAKFRLSCLSSEEYPRFPEVSRTDCITVSCSSLIDIVKRGAYAAGTSDTRYVLNGALMHVNNSILSFVSTDGHRMAVSSLPISQNGDEKKFIISASSVSALKTLLQAEQDAEVEICIDKDSLMFSSNGVSIITKQISGTYPDYKNVIPTDNDQDITVEKEKILNSIKIASSISSERPDSVVAMDIKNNEMILSSVNTDLGDASVKMEISFPGEPMKIGFNPKYLRDAISHIPDEKVILSLKSPVFPVLLKGMETIGSFGIVMPVRIK